MTLKLDDVDLDASTRQALLDSDHGPDETARRALVLWSALDDPDELLRECDLIGGDES